MRQRLLVAACMQSFMCLALPAHAEAVSTPPSAPVAAILGAVLQGDGIRAKSKLRALVPEGLSERDAETCRCMLARLEGAAEVHSAVSDPATRALLDAYEEYWRHAVLGASMRAPAEAQLLARLRRVLMRADLKDIASAEPTIDARLRSAGYYSLEGKTGVLHELMIWRTQMEQPTRVELPEGEQTTRVVYLDGFVSRGWSSFLTCGRSGTGGWTTPQGLYAVVPAYASLQDENFQVNFLAHESQHFADQARFPNLMDWEKEYRAKLVELALAQTTRSKILTAFTSNQGSDPADAHSYANARVLESVRERLGLPQDADLSQVGTAPLQQAAVEVLRADSASREAISSAPHR